MKAFVKSFTQLYTKSTPESNKYLIQRIPASNKFMIIKNVVLTELKNIQILVCF